MLHVAILLLCICICVWPNCEYLLGPFKINGVPIRRVNQTYVIATSTKVDISGVNVEKFDDKYFAREKKQKAKKTEGELFDTEEVTFLHITCTILMQPCSCTILMQLSSITYEFFLLCLLGDQEPATVQEGRPEDP
jgi:hypothetical protein